MNVTVTNSRGQIKTGDIPVVVPEWPDDTSLVGDFDFNDPSIFTFHSTGAISAITNGVSGGGNLTGSGGALASSSGGFTYVPYAFGDHGAMQLTRNISSQTNLCKMIGSAGDPISQAVQGDDKSFAIAVAGAARSTETGYLVSFSATVDATNSEIIGIVGGVPPAVNTVRRLNGTSTALDKTFANTLTVDTRHAMLLSYDGSTKVATLWDNSISVKAVNGAQDQVAYSTNLFFQIGTVRIAGSIYQLVQKSFRYAHILIWDDKLTDAEAQARLLSLNTKCFGTILT